MYEAIARIYMFHLVGCTILAGKPRIYIDAWYISMFSKLEHVDYAWGWATLTVLYITLGEAIVFEVRQLVGYMSLFHGCIFNMLYLFSSYLSKTFFICNFFFLCRVGSMRIYHSFVISVFVVLSLMAPHRSPNR